MDTGAALIVGWILYLMAYMVGLVAVVWVIAHFIGKYW